MRKEQIKRESVCYQGQYMSSEVPEGPMIMENGVGKCLLVPFKPDSLCKGAQVGWEHLHRWIIKCILFWQGM